MIFEALSLAGMGTQVQCKSYLPGCYSMRDLNEDSNGSSWPLFYGDRTLTSGQYYRTMTDAYPGYYKDQLKQKMLEHEDVFRNQVNELHRLYRIQRDMMEEIKRTEINRQQIPIEPSSSSSLFGSQKPSEDAGKWHASSFLLANSGYPRPSVSGAEIVNSPLNCTKGNTILAARVNGCMSNDCEVLETRPSKVRKKLFDLQLPAEEYIDTEEGEQLHNSRTTEVSSSLANGNSKIAPERIDKFFFNGEKVTGQRNASTSDLCLRSSIKVADLNEPVQVEDSVVPPSVNFLGYSANHGESKGVNFSSGLNSEILGLREEVTHTDHSVSQNGKHGLISVVNKSSERHWLSGMHESGEGLYSISGQRKNNMISLPNGFQQDKLTVPSEGAQFRVNNTHQPLGFLSTDYGREEMWKVRTGRGLENMDRVFGSSNNSHLESVITSQISSPYSFGNSSEIANSWSHSALSWGKPTSSFSQKLSSVHAYPSLQSSSVLRVSSNSSAQSPGILGDKLHHNESSRLNPVMATDLPTVNGFYCGSASGSKEIMGKYPSAGMNPPNVNGSVNMSSTRYLNHGPGELSKSCVKPVKDMDLNVQTKCSSDEAVSLHDVDIINEKPKSEDHLMALPWLRAKPSCKSEDANARIDANSELLQASPSKSFWEGEPVKDLNKLLTQEKPIPSGCEVGVKEEIGETQGMKNILGVSFFEKPANFGIESSSSISTSVARPPSHCGETQGMKNILGVSFFEKPANFGIESSSPISTSVACPPSHCGETQGMKNILGVSFFEKPANFGIESSSPISTSVARTPSHCGEKVVMEVKNKLIDINLACDEQIASEALVVEKATDMKFANARNFIDLNSCISEDEELLVPPVTSNNSVVNVVVEIDLEAPALETEDDVLVGEGDKLHVAPQQAVEPDVEPTNDEVVRIAAEAIVSLSTSGHLIYMEENTSQPSEDPLTESLLWFADAITCSADKPESNGGKEIRGTDSLLVGNYSSDEMDDFEVMTLQLQESKEEDYMPKPFVTEVAKVEESGGNVVPNRSRKGQTRRGRQRRDFQRDILPGLASLSRHEVTEDLQTFGGLMRAIGHPWISGLTRRNGTRNGGGRGRRQTVVETMPTVVAPVACTPLIRQLNIEASLEDRSLTGWGKTTRRPRRHRCPAGNPPVPLT